MVGVAWRSFGPLGATGSPAPPDEFGEDTPVPRSREKTRILIVEDEAIVAVAQREILTSAGYEVVGIAAHPADAVRKARRLRPDLMIVDLRLRGDSDGLAAAIEIRELLGIPWVIVSAHLDPETLANVQAAHPLGTLSKPYLPRELLDVIGSALRQLE